MLIDSYSKSDDRFTGIKMGHTGLIDLILLSEEHLRPSYPNSMVEIGGLDVYVNRRIEIGGNVVHSGFTVFENDKAVARYCILDYLGYNTEDSPNIIENIVKGEVKYGFVLYNFTLHTYIKWKDCLSYYNNLIQVRANPHQSYNNRFVTVANIF